MLNVGISVPLPAYHVDVAFMARTAEALGFESFWCAEHPFIPVHTTSRFPGSADGIIPETYSHFIDPFVALARHWTSSAAAGSCSGSARAGCGKRRRSWAATSTTAGRRRASRSWP